VGALLNNLSFLQHNDVVSLLDCREAMSNGDGCAALSNSVESGLDDLLTLRVDCAGCFVEDNDTGLLDDASGDR
jgi:hypothetical protein